jgi:hypothetical protein
LTPPPFFSLSANGVGGEGDGVGAKLHPEQSVGNALPEKDIPKRLKTQFGVAADVNRLHRFFDFPMK